jgi:hypothetical protein
MEVVWNGVKMGRFLFTAHSIFTLSPRAKMCNNRGKGCWEPRTQGGAGKPTQRRQLGTEV